MTPKAFESKASSLEKERATKPLHIALKLTNGYKWLILPKHFGWYSKGAAVASCKKQAGSSKSWNIMLAKLHVPRFFGWFWTKCRRLMAPSGKAAKSKILVSARDKGPAVKTDFNQNRLAKTKRYHSWCCAAGSSSHRKITIPTKLKASHVDLLERIQPELCASIHSIHSSLQPGLRHQGTKKGSAHANYSCIFHACVISFMRILFCCVSMVPSIPQKNKSREAPCNPQCTKLNGPSIGFDWDANKRSWKNALKQS